MNKNVKTGLVILAAGSAKRFGTDKLLKEFDGKPLLQIVLDNLKDAPCYKKVVVVRPDFPVERFDFSGYEMVLNHSHIYGISSSLKVGFNAFLLEEPEGIFITLGDMPFIYSSDIVEIRKRIVPEDPKIISFVHEGKKGFPTFIPGKFFKRIMELHGDRGASVLINDNKSAFIPLGGQKRHCFDIDTENDFKEALKTIERPEKAMGDTHRSR
ncbi:conserved hypothetical protein [Kosmotoga olearia TBF 19.5.1]|uniref:MobA-like NTP transferase domain-containing protein n=1 Tax=Kosmotoga olearia (strain ATCC BAA-1733 / DSM 21960 / TBF 19.5.1) TaxID=521045 RepID=C5CHS2_KOSOT|nr:conserved hypothetical protein [Kosmotoga olearia TBF 19.5.1]